MRKRRCVFGLIFSGLLFWAWPKEAPTPAASPTPAGAKETQTRWVRSSRPRPVSEAAPKAGPAAIALKRGVHYELIHVYLSSDSALQQPLTVFNSFRPSSFLPPVSYDDMPDTETADALVDMLNETGRGGLERTEDFLDAVDQDPELEGFDQDWADMIDLETERLLAEEAFDANEEQAMDMLLDVHFLPDPETRSQLDNLPAADRDFSEMIALAREIIDDDPLSEVADVARLYAAQGLSDYMSHHPHEGIATDLLLDTLATSESAAIHRQAIRMLVQMSPGKLHRDDISLLEHAWYTLEDGDKSQLSRFLMTQQFAKGDLARADVWADRFEADVLSAEWSPGTSRDFLLEVDQARARIGARWGSTPRSWKVGVEQAAWACWEGPDGKKVTSDHDRLSFTGEWEDGWSFQARTPSHPLTKCILEQLEDTADPGAALTFRLSISIFGLRD